MRILRVIMIIWGVIGFTASASADKVVVIPLPADSVNKGLVPVAVGSIGSAGEISQGYGVTSVSNTVTGIYDVTLDSQISTLNPIVLITPFTIGFGIPEIAGYDVLASDPNTFRVNIQNSDGIARNSGFSFAVYHIE